MPPESIAEDDADTSDEEDLPLEPEKEEVEKKTLPTWQQEKQLIKSITEKNKVLHRCPYPGCTFKHEKLQAVFGHMRFIHKTRGEYLDANGNLVKKTPLVFPGNKPPSKSAPSAAQQRSVTRMGDNEAGEPVEPGRKAEVKGRLRQLLKVIALAESDKRDALIPMREVLMDYIRLLSKANINEAELAEVSNRLDDQVYPEVEQVLGKDKITLATTGVASATSASAIPKLAILGRMSKLRGATKQYMSYIARLPPSKRDDLFSERETLTMLHRRLGAKEIPEDDMTEMEDVFEGEVKPAVDAAISSAPKTAAPKKDAGSDEMGGEIQMKEDELKLTRMDRMLSEEKLRTKQTLEAMRASGSATGSGALVPVVRPMITETGEIKRDKEGKVVMETTYSPVDQAGNSNNLLMTLLLSGKLGGGDNNALLVAMMDNNSKVMTALLTKGDDSKSTKEMMLEMQNNNLKMMMEMQKGNQEMIASLNKNKGDDPAITQMREELRAAREEGNRVRDSLNRQQFDYMHKEMEELKAYAYRDDLDTLLKQREKMERLGVVNPPNKDAETKALEQSTQIAKQALDKVDRIGSDMKSLMQPFADAQAVLIKAQAQQGRPLRPNYSEEQKNETYKKILQNIEEEEEKEEGGE